MKVSEINIYPVKSLGRISLRSSIVEDRGLQFDRRFLLVDQDGRFLTQREHSRMATIDVQFGKSGFVVSTDKYGEINIENDFKDSEKILVQIWRSFCDALVAPKNINDWFSNVLEFECKLVQMPESTRRQINEKFNKGDEVVSFADGYPVLVIGESSLEDLNSKLTKQIPMNRFRPNIVVTETEAFEEDSWKKIKIGETTFRSTKPCARCVVTTIDQKTGISDIQEPLKTLASYRKSTNLFPDIYEKLGLAKNDVLFGQNLVAENFGKEIKVGDEILIID